MKRFKYLERKKSFKDEINALFIIFRGQIKQIKQYFLEGESPALGFCNLIL